MSKSAQAPIADFQAGTTTETVTKTIICKLETSSRKNERVRQVIDGWQEAAGRMADLMPSIDRYRWRAQDTTIARVVTREFPETILRSHDLNQAAYKVAEAFGSWRSNQHDKEQPTFGNGDYARFCHCGVTIEENDRGYGVKIGLEPYDAEWFHINVGPYQREYLDGVVNGDMRSGSAELHLSNDGNLRMHLSVSRDVEVYEPADVPRTVGVDLGERVLFAAVVSDGSDVLAVDMESGDEFRHHREQLKRKRSELMGRGDLRGVKKCRDEHARYTDHITHTASRRIVDLAVEHEPAAIRLEDLTGYRQSADNAIHDWPYAELQEKIAYKATEAGIPVSFVDPKGTSYTCSECGSAVPENRSGVDFECRRCGYEVHADVNAAKNIATGGGDFL